MGTETEAREELWERIEDVRTAMLTTVDPDGMLRSRPMWTQGDEFDGSLWFFIAKDSPSAEAIAQNSRVGLAYGAPDKDLYLSVVGQGHLVEDEAKAEEMWNTFVDAWFPGGSDDPNLTLLRVDVEQAQYWQDKKPKVLQLAEIVIGAVTDRPPKSGEERKLNFGES